MPLGLKNKMVNLHTTTTEVKIDHTIRPLLTHMSPPPSPQKYAEFLCGGEGIIRPLLPTLTGLEVEAKKPLLLLKSEVYKSTEKRNKYD